MTKTYTKIEGNYTSEDDIKILVREEKTVVTEEIKTLLSLRSELKGLEEKLAPEKIEELTTQKEKLEDFLSKADVSLEVKAVQPK